MATQWISVALVREGIAVAGSPFSVKLRYRRLHIDPQIAPAAARRPVQEFLIFQEITAAVEVGDFATLPGGQLAKLIDVRAYPESLQCMLQRLPYSMSQTWTPGTISAQTGPDKSLSDPVYVASGTAYVLLEPHGLDQPGPLPAGYIDRRSGWIFSTTSLTALTVLLIGQDYWLVTATSGFWQVSNDYRAPCRRMATPPIGVA